MCGICGMFGKASRPTLERMTEALAHRGPDGSGLFVDQDAGVGLGHTRLSILDPGERGAQPMHAGQGRLTITYNGEIYNSPELRRRLSAFYTFRTTTDTEVILRAYQHWGRDCVHELNGMFAFALWDRDEDSLWLVRDRLGIKPLYYSMRCGQLRFASEVRAITADRDWPKELDLDAVDAFLRFRYVPPPSTLFRGIQSLAPGCSILISKGSFHVDRYWAPRWERRPVSDAGQAQERFSALLDDAVEMQLLSDVPLGVFLSGGVDSGVVASLAARHSQTPVQAFTIGFADGGDGIDDELADAAARAAQLGCDHHTLQCGAQDFLRLPDIVKAMDMPVGDTVIVPTFMLSEFARGHVKTVLTGEGGDEILAGYAHQRQLAQLAGMSRWLPSGFAALLRLAVRVLPSGFWDRFFLYGGRLGTAGTQRMLALAEVIREAVPRYLEYTSVFGGQERPELYRGALARRAGQVVPMGLDTTGLNMTGLNMTGQSIAGQGSRGLKSGADPLRGLMRQECQTWLPGNILMKQDVLTMANSLEGRVPLLDHRLVEEVVSWDRKTFARLARGKAAISASLPRTQERRPKRPFMFSMAGRTGGELRRMVRERLFSESSRMAEFIDPACVRRMEADFDDSPLLRSKQLTALLVLELWLEENA